MEEVVFKTAVSPVEVAAIVFEPIQGEGGYVVPPPEFFDELKKVSRKYDILLVADEVQSGMGRTGRMFAVDHFQLEADILCLAKGIASGMPLGATVASDRIMNWQPGSHASTFGGNPISCAVALETIRLLQENLIENAERVGNFLITGLRKLAEKHAMIGDVRGKGLMIGIELVKSRNTKERAKTWRDSAIQKCFERGLLVLGCGENTLRLMPPLIVTEEQAQVALDLLDEVLAEVGRSSA